MLRNILWLPALALATTGCVTNLDATLDPTDKPPVGLPYQLPRTAVTATVVWTMETCPMIEAVEGGGSSLLSLTDETGASLFKSSTGQIMALESGKGDIPSVSEVLGIPKQAEFKPTAGFTTETIGGETYSIDYEELTQGTKTGSIKVEYHEGTLLLKTINAKVDGKEAEALKSAFSLAGNVARIALSIPPKAMSTKSLTGSKSGARKISTFSACNTTTLALLEQKKALSATIKEIEVQAAALTAQVAVISAQRVNGQLAAPETLDELQRKALAVQDRLTATKAALAKVTDYLSVEAKVTLPGKGSPPAYGAPVVPEDKAIAALRQRILSDDCSKDPNCLAADDLKRQFLVTATLAARSGGIGCEAPGNPACSVPTETVEVPGDTGSRAIGVEQGRQAKKKVKRERTGLIIRQPVEAILTLTQDANQKVILEKPLMVAQFGLRRTLPLRNGFAEGNTLAAVFDKNGMPTSIEYSKPRSSAVELLGALDEGAQTILALQADKRAAAKADADAEVAVAKAELEALQRQRDMIKLEAEIAALQQVTPAENEALKAEIATLELLKQIAELKKAIAAASPPPPG